MTADRRSAAGEFVLLGDQPHSAVGDPLGFDEIVDGLVHLILGSREATPFTFGIEGTWGTGKSTLMGALRKRLAEREKEEVTTVQFNAWTAREGEVLEAFVKTVLGAIKPHHLRHALYKQKAIGLARFGLGTAAGFVGQSQTLEKAWDLVATDPRARNELRDLIQVTVDGWRKGNRGETRLLCVFVDDLDRCSPKVVLEVLEAMKLYLDVKGIVFVVGYDDDIVSEVVLRDKGYGDKTKARDYLEKFIQVSYRIPPAQERQSEALIETALEASGTSHLLQEGERRLVIEGSSANPRRIKRFINSFILVYGLDSRWSNVEPQGLVRALLLQIYFPEFARLLERGQDDPVAEFLDYVFVRSALRRENLQRSEREKVGQVLERYELPVPLESEGAELRDLLGRLEERTRVEFRGLVSRGDFVALVRELSEGENWEELRTAFSRGELAQIEAEGLDDFVRPWRGDGLEGRRVLWVDDNPEGNRELRELMVRHGAHVTTAKSFAEIDALLREEMFSVLISDITREDDPDAGFKALEWARDKGVSLPPLVVFFTGIVTPLRVERAEQFSAKITSDPNTLLNFVVASPRDER